MWGPVTETVLEEGSNKNSTFIFQCWLKKRKKKRVWSCEEQKLKELPLNKNDILSYMTHSKSSSAAFLFSNLCLVFSLGDALLSHLMAALT